MDLITCFLACIENTQMLRMWVKKPFQKFRLGSAFYGEGRLRAFISLTFLGKITKFLCSLEWKFPEFFKTHPTFICSSFLRPLGSFEHKGAFFFGTPCISPYQLLKYWNRANPIIIYWTYWMSTRIYPSYYFMIITTGSGRGPIMSLSGKYLI